MCAPCKQVDRMALVREVSLGNATEGTRLSNRFARGKIGHRLAGCYQ